MTVARPFSPFSKLLRATLRDESAQGLVEYAIILGLVAMVALAVVRALGRHVTNSLSSASNGFS
jgi:Flp pilus assembly pilin Flp